MPLVLLLAVAAVAALALGAARGTSPRTGGSPDPGMPPEEWTAVEEALSTETDPIMLDAFANLLESQGFAKSAALLRQKAVTIGG